MEKNKPPIYDDVLQKKETVALLLIPNPDKRYIKMLSTKKADSSLVTGYKILSLTKSGIINHRYGNVSKEGIIPIASN